MVRLCVTSDWHLDAVTAGVDRYPELSNSAGDVIAGARAQKAKYFVFLGDLCDPDAGGDAARSHRAVAEAAMVKRHVEESGMTWIAIAGNHDVIEDGHGTTTLSALAKGGGYVFEQPAMKQFEGFTLIALPFTARSHKYDPDEFVRRCAAELARPGGPGPVVVAGHLNIEGISPGSETKDMPRGRDVYFPYDACAELLPNALLMNGHYHEQQMFRPKKKGPYIYIPGSLGRLTFGDAHHKPGYLMAEV